MTLEGWGFRLRPGLFSPEVCLSALFHSSVDQTTRYLSVFPLRVIIVFCGTLLFVLDYGWLPCLVGQLRFMLVLFGLSMGGS